ncbi:tripartite tricarboxylate transporter receptor family protein [Paraburkholderia xenovorans LB400]|jgi:tripartite-type tricarboxylate transporter receptor subunit TctC|uniref:Exported protein n=1 Tax=Paraburkholderia xenovorans (strain LB400) TaxID=266265 RepID=Q13PB8_PARXL|nr:tripartite tricarboxylate transporter substrate binding protein [Paraburkholderia xenovorans]ABE34071.1 Putative exported protein [Paraburkholderia xenovorans LB400]AIP37843.1 tripartite tricarboxylate transporter receptor family protein [Paraburkholderia xenovorans LB400]
MTPRLLQRFSRPLRYGLLVAAAAISLPWAMAAHAEWPDRTITLVVPFPPGGNTDVLGRIVAAKLTTTLGVHVIVENRPGAGSMLGTQFVAKAKPDGYTILMGSIANVLNDYFYRKPLYDIRKDLIPVSQVVNVPNYFAVNPALKVTTLAQLVSYAKQNPGKASCATSGVGTSPYLSCELFKRMAGVQMTTIPYQGGIPAIQDTIGGRESVAVVNEALPYIRNHQLTGVAVTSAQRSPLAPDMPAVSESVPGYDVTSWYGVFVPAGTPPDIVSKLGAEIGKAMQSPDVKKQLEPLGAIPVGSSPPQFQQFVNAELAKWGKVAKELNLHLD